MSRTLVVAASLLLLVPTSARAAEILCDPAHEDCRATLLSYIQRETQRIDVAMWFMEDPDMANALIARHKAGVPVRALVDPRRNDKSPMNATILSMLQNGGVPMRYKSAGGQLHMKFMVFHGLDTVQFSAANYSDYYFKPKVPYLDYTDEGIYFCDDPPIADSFRRKFDDMWIDTVNFSNYANVSTTPSRAYDLFPLDPTLNFVPWEDFGKRSVPLYDAETRQIDVIMYKITEASHVDGLIRAKNRGVPVRVITEPDLYRNTGNVWQGYHVDRLYAAGVQVRDRAHAGFNHQKTTLLYGQAMTVFGSSNWTNDSNRVQYEHNYFTKKVWFFNWFRDNFERKWHNSTGNAETKPFVPLPPDVPVYLTPANSGSGVATDGTASLSWKPGLWAHRADVYFGTSSAPPLLAANVSVSPNTTKTYKLPVLAAGTTYYWRVVSKTMAGKTAAGPTWSFTTAGGTSPPPPPPPDTTAGEIVLYAANATVTGAWSVLADSTAAGGKRLWNPNAGAAKIVTALANPANYVELTFTADAGRPYRLWFRGKAEGNSYANDSVHVQFSGSVNSSGAAVSRIGSTTSTEYNLEACSGCGLSGWGWEDNGWGTGVLGPQIYFATTGTQRIRIQPREDGLSIDQIVLSPQQYLTASPGTTKNDTTILPASGGSSTPPPPPSSSSTEIVLYAAEAAITGTGWTVQTDSTAAGGKRIWNPNANVAKITTAVAAPASYIELTFTADAGRPYRLWVRGRAEGNSYANDSVHVQFSGSVTSTGTATYRIGTTSATSYNLEACSGCGLSGWGWEDNGWGIGVLGPQIYFATTGTQRIRIQSREDGLSIDQIVLSAQKYLTTAPGPTKNDTTILSR
jgi:hypothetical protein